MMRHYPILKNLKQKSRILRNVPYINKQCTSQNRPYGNRSIIESSTIILTYSANNPHLTQSIISVDVLQTLVNLSPVIEITPNEGGQEKELNQVQCVPSVLHQAGGHRLRLLLPQKPIYDEEREEKQRVQHRQ